jgi:hypothetical protein
MAQSTGEAKPIASAYSAQPRAAWYMTAKNASGRSAHCSSQASIASISSWLAQPWPITSWTTSGLRQIPVLRLASSRVCANVP